MNVGLSRKWKENQIQEKEERERESIRKGREAEAARSVDLVLAYYGIFTCFV